MIETRFAFFVADDIEAEAAVSKAMDAAQDAFELGKPGIIIAQVARNRDGSIQVEGVFVPNALAQKFQALVGELAPTSSEGADLGR